MSNKNVKTAIRQILAVFRRELNTCRQVAADFAARVVDTPDGFDRRAFGPIVASMKRNGEIVAAGFRISETAKHLASIERPWVLASTNENGGADNAE